MIKLHNPATGALLWQAFPKQHEALTRTEFEILFGGARGGGKTAAGIIWLIIGNDIIGFEHSSTVADEGYYRHAQYRALVLRRNVNDMEFWISQAKQIYGSTGKELLGAVYTARPCQFRFPSGATIVIGHLDDDDAYMKYQGSEYTRVLIEELGQIPNAELYLKVMASCRTPFDELHPQIFLTANPGGPGGYWVRDRFVRVTTPGQPYTHPETGLTRIYIPAGVRDNEVYAKDARYLGQLMSLPPALRRAWLEGDWDAISGQAFEEFRLQPLQGEPKEAQHVVDSASVVLEPWYTRWLSCDWGYAHNAAVYSYCAMPNGQIHVTDEMVVNRTTPEELGVELARFVWGDLRAGAQKSLQLYLSPDAFSKRTDERTIADQIAIGIEKILGTNSVYIMPAGEDAAPSEVFGRKDLQTSASIVITRAANQRVAGWMFMHGLMRWWPLLGDAAATYDPTYALKLYDTDRIKWREYQSMFSRAEEVLPKLQIHGDKCPLLVTAIPKAMSQDPDKGDPNDIIKEHWDGADEVDSLRYGLFAYRFIQNNEPFEVYYANHLAKYATKPLAELSGQSKVMMARTAEAKYKALTTPLTKPLDWRRSSTRQRRRGGA